MPAEAHSLVRRYYTYAGIYTLAASIIWGINTLFLLDAGLSIAEVFIANAAFSLGTVLFEIPTGVVADTIGRRASFLLSLIVLAGSTLAYVGLAQAGAGVVAFSIASVFIGLGFTFYSGAMEAWLVDGVHGLGYEGEMDGIFANAQIIGGVAMLVGTVGGGFLGQVNLALPFVVRSVLLVVLFGLAFFGMHDVGFQSRKVTWKTLPSEAAAIGVSGVRHGWRNRPLRLIMIAGAMQMGFFMWAWYAWQPYFLELLERDAVWVAGVVAALLSLAMIAGNSLVKFFMRFHRRRLGGELSHRSGLPPPDRSLHGCPDAGSPSLRSRHRSIGGARDGGLFRLDDLGYRRRRGPDRVGDLLRATGLRSRIRGGRSRGCLCCSIRDRRPSPTARRRLLRGNPCLGNGWVCTARAASDHTRRLRPSQHLDARVGRQVGSQPCLR